MKSKVILHVLGVSKQKIIVLSNVEVSYVWYALQSLMKRWTVTNDTVVKNLPLPVDEKMAK